MTTPWLATLAAVAMMAALLALALRVTRSARGIHRAVARVVDDDLANAFIFLDGQVLLQVSASAAAALAVIAYLTSLNLASTGVLIGAMLIAPRLVLSRLRSRRQQRMLRQLPDAIQALAALLRAGHALGQAAATLAETQPRPLQDEWRLLLRRMRMGERADTAFELLAQRIAAPEARLFATTIRIALELGGSLAEALEHLADATRRRLEMQARIAALTSQGRLQGMIVGALPLLLLLVLSTMDAQAMQLLWTRPGGWAALGVLLCLEVCGFVMIRRIVRIDV
jgi:tight adherence protein B